MKSEDLKTNRDAWNSKTPYHVDSKFYDVEGFRAGASSLNPLELALVARVKDQSLLHLQCHFGLDTLSFARLGAHVTGLDFSPVAIAEATRLAADVGLEAKFVCSDVHQAPQALHGEQFDVVFTSYGALPWLPSMSDWARAAAACVAPGGRLVVVEFHPFVWVWDDAFTRIVYPWDSGAQAPIEETTSGTYADPEAPITLKTTTWNHSVASVVTAIANEGLVVERLVEDTRSPYNVFQTAIRDPAGGYYVGALGPDAPLLFGLVAKRPLAKS